MAEGTVILVHGLWTGPWIMGWIGRALARRGLRTAGFGYASVQQDLATNAAALARRIRETEADTLHFVAHSLGGPVVATALAAGASDRPGRVVLLGSPLQGCYAATRLARLPMGNTLMGRTVREWLERPLPRWSAPQPLGVIAGDGGLGLGRLVVPDLPPPHDGVVRVEETRIEGLKEHRVLPVSHSEMLVSAAVAELTARFLLHGSFDAP